MIHRDDSVTDGICGHCRKESEELKAEPCGHCVCLHCLDIKTKCPIESEQAQLVEPSTQSSKINRLVHILNDTSHKRILWIRLSNVHFQMSDFSSDHFTKGCINVSCSIGKHPLAVSKVMPE